MPKWRSLNAKGSVVEAGVTPAGEPGVTPGGEFHKIMVTKSSGSVCAEA